jgi:Antibiotic biosynthesis monooxygenase
LSRTIEIGRFSVKPGEEEEFLAERAAMAEAARAQFEGLLDESLLRLEDGSYMTIWVWAERKFCDLALAQVSRVEPVQSWLSHMDKEPSMEFGVLIDTKASVES